MEPSNASRSLAQAILTQEALSHALLEIAANQLLADFLLLSSLTDKERWQLCERLFPYFTLVPGWLKVARASKLTDKQIAKLIIDRVLAIRSIEDAKFEAPFLRELATPASDTRLAYYPLLIPSLRAISDVFETHAPPEIFSLVEDRIGGWKGWIDTAKRWWSGRDENQPPRW